MIQFYAPNIKDELTLPEEESAHCCRVLRMRAGDRIPVVDGRGIRYECEIEEPHQRHTRVRILSEERIAKPWRGKITLAVAPTKNMDRIEWLIEKCVEIGIDEIIPVLCEHSERKVVKKERLEKIVVSAMKQSLKAERPEVWELTPYREFVAEMSCRICGKYMGYCDADYERRSFVKEYEAGTDVVILIGPEGDFSAPEVSEAVSAGFVPVTFGEIRLRTETAALYGVEAVHILDDLRQCTMHNA